MSEIGGFLRFQKRFSFSPSAFITYNLDNFGADLYVGPEENLESKIMNSQQGGLDTPGFMSLVTSFEGYINIYKDIKLAWTTKMPI
jgi:hypothetical protein